MGDENVENHQLEDIVFMCNQMLTTDLKQIQLWK